jgi:23S rRNA-/tRNA-specific pseudouridylate synthase
VKEITISSLEAGQRFDKYLVKCLPNATKSFLYKMLRKKNITLNRKKAEGSEKLAAGDVMKNLREQIPTQTRIQKSGQTPGRQNVHSIHRAKCLKVQADG